MKKRIAIRGGARFGRSLFESVRVSYPFATLEVLNNELVITIRLFFSWKKQLILTRGDIIEIKAVKTFWRWGVQIEHIAPESPKFLAFLCCRPSRISNFLNKWLVHNDA